MKKTWGLMVMTLVAVFILNVNTVTYGAEENGTANAGINNIIEEGETVTTSTSVEYFEDGSYEETMISSVRVEDEISTTSASSSSYFVIRSSKTVTSYNSSGDKLWSVSVTGTFRVVTGVSSTCIDATGETASYESGWKVGDPTIAYSGNTARATATASHYLAFIKMSSQTLTAALACDVYGNMN